MSDSNAFDTSVSGIDSEASALGHTAPATPPATDHLPGPDTDCPTTPTTPPADPIPSNPGPTLPTNDPQGETRSSFVRHCPSSTNRDAYTKKSGRQLAPLLIDESGMGPRFHLLDNEVFSARIPGEKPSEADRKKFKSPKLRKGMLERDIYPQLGAVVQSVLKAAKCKKLRFIDTANHKAKDGNRGRTETFNDAGLYRDTPRARNATDLDDTRLSKSKMLKKQLKERMLGARSWFWMDVPIEVKGDEKNSAFYFKTKPKKTWADSMHPAAASSRSGDPPADAGTQESGVRPEEEVEGGEQAEEDQGMLEEVTEEGDDEEGDEEEDEEEEDEGEEEVDDDLENDPEEFEDEDLDVEFGEDEDLDVEDEEETPAEEQEHSTNVAGIIKKPVPPFIKLSDNGEQALGQFVEYHLNLFKFQHRTFCYSIYVCFDMARLLYFDHAGAYVSEPFSWVEPTSLLHEFVWKFAKLANAKRLGDMGHDTTAKMVSLSTRKKYLKEAKNADLPAHVRAGLLKAAKDDCPLYELVVKDVPPSPDEWFPDEAFPEPRTAAPSQPSGSTSSDSPSKSTPVPDRHFIVGCPHFSADALVGRCTKGYMAFDVTNRRKWVPCFLKDSWRPYVRGRTRPEHVVYERFKRKNVQKEDGIATLVCGGDVGGHRAQCTRVQRDLPPENRPVPRVHYRLVIEEIGLPLSTFDNFGDLSLIFVDALKAHQKVLDRAGVLHRDISLGNIMIRVEGGIQTGFLIDWDLSRLESELGKGPVEPDRTGTWQFRSALSVRYPRKPYKRSDDIESFIHAYLYLVLRYHPTDVTSVKDMVVSLFEQASLVGGIKVGGDAKFAMIKSGRVPFEVANNILLQDLLSTLIRGCSHAYSQLDSRVMARLYGPETEPPRAHAFGSSNSDSSGSGSDSSPPPRARPRRRARRASDDQMLQASDDEELDKVLRRGRQNPAQPAPAMESCEVGKFLSSSRRLIQLFSDHSQDAYDIRDKARDQFRARHHQNIFVVPEQRGSRGIATLSTTASVPSEEGLPGEGLPEHDQFGSGLNSGADAPPPSSSPSFRAEKRGRSQPSFEAEDESADEEEERRRVKRLKGKGTDKGKTRRRRG